MVFTRIFPSTVGTALGLNVKHVRDEQATIQKSKTLIPSMTILTGRP
jgi:hypothetical protein